MEILIGLKNSALRGGQISEVERNQVWSENGMLTPELLNREQLFSPNLPSPAERKAYNPVQSYGREMGHARLNETYQAFWRIGGHVRSPG